MILNQVVEVSAEAAASFHSISSLMTLMLIALICAAFSLFLDYLLEDHPLGQWYLSQLQKLPTFWAKPLGECPYCSGAWQYLVISCLMFDYPFYLCSIYLGLNHLFLLLLSLMQRQILSKLQTENQSTEE